MALCGSCNFSKCSFFFFIVLSIGILLHYKVSKFVGDDLTICLLRVVYL